METCGQFGGRLGAMLYMCASTALPTISTPQGRNGDRLLVVGREVDPDDFDDLDVVVERLAALMRRCQNDLSVTRRVGASSPPKPWP